MISDADIEKAAKAIAGVRELYPHDFDLWLTEARAALEVVGYHSWVPIDDDAKKGPFLVCTDKNQYVGRWVKNPYTDDEAFAIADLPNGERMIVKPTHYRPLGDLPTC